MPAVYLMEWTNVNRDQYEALIQGLNWTEKLKKGNIAYAQGAAGGSLMVIETWDTPTAFDLFLQTRFSQALIATGLTQPKITTWQISNPGQPPSSPIRRSLLKTFWMAGSLPGWKGIQAGSLGFSFN